MGIAGGYIRCQALPPNAGLDEEKPLETGACAISNASSNDPYPNWM